MAFLFEQIHQDNQCDSTEEYRKAVEMSGGLGYSRRVVDRERTAELYCLSVNSWEDRPPGEYLLFWSGEVVRIHAYHRNRWVDGFGRIASFQITSINIPVVLEPKRALLIQLIADALEAHARGSDKHVVAVEVTFD